MGSAWSGELEAAVAELQPPPVDQLDFQCGLFAQGHLDGDADHQRMAFQVIPPDGGKIQFLVPKLVEIRDKFLDALPGGGGIWHLLPPFSSIAAKAPARI